MTEFPREKKEPVPEESVGAVYGYGPFPLLTLRCTVGGVLMGLANLVPGISGGTMLLASGIYPQFIEAIAELTTLRVRLRSLFVLGMVLGTGALAILTLAGTVVHVVVAYRWAMFSLFIGLTLGGVPVVWSMAKPANQRTWAGAASGFVLMAAIAAYQKMGAGGDGSDAHVITLFLGGVFGAAAMILPGISGSYLLLVLGVYAPIFAAVNALKVALVAGNPAGALGPLTEILIPVGLGVGIGVVGVSNLIKRALERYPDITLGSLLGFLVGSVVGLWPFERFVRPAVGDLHRGVPLTVETLAELPPHKYPTETFDPSSLQVVYCLGLILAGFAITAVVAKFGGTGASGEDEEVSPGVIERRGSGEDEAL